MSSQPFVQPFTFSVATPQTEFLRLTAYLITGDVEASQHCFRDFRCVNTTNDTFRTWLCEWSLSATIDNALRFSLNRSTDIVGRHGCVQIRTSDLKFSFEVIGRVVRRAAEHNIVSDLGFLARIIFVLRCVLGLSVSDCSNIIGVGREQVVVAHCEAMDWLKHKDLVQLTS
jgi:hypothetical protein